MVPRLTMSSALDCDRKRTFERDGALLFENALSDSVCTLEALLAELPADAAGTRIHGLKGLDAILQRSGSIGSVAARLLGGNARPVRAILFNKSATSNWSLGWHQDRTVTVVERRDVAGFGAWTIKSGLHHVAPPFEILANMITLRAHLDDVPETNAPLLVALGSHRLGPVSEHRMSDIVGRSRIGTCLAKRGDIWAYSTPIVHASKAAAVPLSRRVLQVDYAVGDLPGGLKWLGV